MVSSKVLAVRRIVLTRFAMLMNGILYVVATPIGNLGDVTRRGQEVLAAVTTIACEDTRRTASLLAHLGIPKPKLVALHEHNEDSVGERLVERLRGGEDVALVSDAGTPLLSDPGFLLLRRCWDAQVKCVPIPGPASPIAALSVCPLPTNGFFFQGFLAAKAVRRREQLQGLLARENAVVFFEAPHRIEGCLEDIDALAPTRRVFVARELTKQYEHLLCGPAAEVLAELQQAQAVRGEFVCVLEGAAPVDTGDEVSAEHQRLLQLLCEEMGPAKAARLVASFSGLKKSRLYDLALTFKS